MLTRCLNSLSDITPAELCSVSVMVVDNDAGCSAAPIVNNFKGVFPFPLRYVSEIKRGIPYARNRAIEETLGVGSDYLVFIDDDEYVEPGWLDALYSYSQKVGGKSVVHGSVIAELPDGTPAHIAGLFGGKLRPTGLKLSSCATDNVIIPAYVFGDLGLRFDETQPLAGGTDTKYFVEAVSRGVEIYQCSEAVVRETIPSSRATLKWLMRRKFRAGITEVWRKQRAGKSLVLIFLSAMLKLLVELARTAFFLVAGNSLRRNQSFLKVSKASGVLAGLAGINVDSYKVIDG